MILLPRILPTSCANAKVGMLGGFLKEASRLDRVSNKNKMDLNQDKFRRDIYPEKNQKDRKYLVDDLQRCCNNEGEATQKLGRFWKVPNINLW